jgi:hypothetical protein
MKLAITGENFWLWFGGIWLIVGVPFLVSGLYGGWQQVSLSERLQTQGQVVSGMVLTKYIDPSSSHDNSAASTPTYWVTFRFSSESGDVIKGKAQVAVDTWDSLIERHPIQITYLPDAPQSYRVAGETSQWILPFVFIGLGGFFTTAGGFAFLHGLRVHRVTERVRREGTLVEAMVMGVQPAQVRINGTEQWVIQYEFTDRQGRKRAGKSLPLPPEEAETWESGDRGLIRYDPRAPRQSLWIGKSEGPRA